jgi:cell division protein FtsL
VASWEIAAAPLEAPLPSPRPRGPATPRPAARRRPVAPRIRVAGGIVWIAFLTALLTGVVAMNVTVLRLNMQLDQLGRERSDLRAGNAELASRISSAAATGRIQTLAQKRLGLVPADPAETGYLDLRSRR